MSRFLHRHLRTILAGVLGVLLVASLLLWKPNPAHAFSSRTWVDGNVQAFQWVPNTNNVLVEGLDLNLWYEYGSMQNRYWVDGSVLAFQFAGFASSGVPQFYVLGIDHNLWYETGSMQNRYWVDGNVQAFQWSGTGTDVYVLGGGNLWLDHHDMHTRALIDQGVTVFQAISNTLVYVLIGTYPNDALYQENPSTGSRSCFAGCTDPYAVFSFVATSVPGQLAMMVAARFYNYPNGSCNPCTTGLVLNMAMGSITNSTDIYAGDGVTEYQPINYTGSYWIVDVLARGALSRCYGSYYTHSDIDTNVLSFSTRTDNTSLVYVEGLDHNLWLEQV